MAHDDDQADVETRIPLPWIRRAPAGSTQGRQGSRSKRSPAKPGRIGITVGSEVEVQGEGGKVYVGTITAQHSDGTIRNAELRRGVRTDDCLNASLHTLQAHLMSVMAREVTQSQEWTRLV